MLICAQRPDPKPLNAGRPLAVAKIAVAKHQQAPWQDDNHAAVETRRDITDVANSPRPLSRRSAGCHPLRKIDGWDQQIEWPTSVAGGAPQLSVNAQLAGRAVAFALVAGLLRGHRPMESRDSFAVGYACILFQLSASLSRPTKCQSPMLGCCAPNC